MSKTLSIIIPTYNRADLLKRLLGQLLAQIQLPYEIIIVDDHSTDHTRHVAREFLLASAIGRYALNDGHHLANARRTGIRLARGNYLSFIDDDVIIEDKNFLAKLQPLLSPRIMIQPKVIMENFGQVAHDTLTISDVLATRPYPILELITAKLNRGTRPRRVFPFNELGVFWHRDCNHFWTDGNLIGDAYGQSYSTALRLRQAGVKIIFRSELLLRHPGAPSGGSKKFNKKLMMEDFTRFHYDYFYNMIYLNARAFPGWVWLWLPYFFLKSLIALAMNRNVTGWREYALKPMGISLRKHLLKASGAQRSIFIWQGSWQGGAEYITLSMAQYLSARNFDVTLGVWNQNQNVSLRQIVFPRFIVLPQSFRSLAASLLFRARHASSFDAVYTHTLGFWKSHDNKLFIHEAADLDQKLQQMESPARQAVFWLWRWLYQTLTLKRATAVFAATPECAAYLRRIGINPSHIVPSASFFAENIFAFTEHRLPGRPVKVIFVGNYRDPAKRFDIFRKLVETEPGLHGIVAGGKQHANSQHLTFVGYLSPANLHHALSQADILLFPSASEGFPVALLEALASGIPCVANRAAVPSSLQPARNLVIYDDENEVAGAIQRVISHYQHYQAPDPSLAHFTRTRVLTQEVRRITACLVNPRPGSVAANQPDKKTASAPVPLK